MAQYFLLSHLVSSQIIKNRSMPFTLYLEPCNSVKTHLNTLRPRQNGRHFADDTFKRIFLNENVRISIKISLKFVPKGSFNNIPALVQIMAWRRPGDKPLSEPMMFNLPTHICVTRPQWVNRKPLFTRFGPVGEGIGGENMQRSITTFLFQIMICQQSSPSLYLNNDFQHYFLRRP